MYPAGLRQPVDCTPAERWAEGRQWTVSAASIGKREVQIQADGRRAAWRAETMQIVCDFRPPTISVATRTLTSGARRNGRRARDARDAGRSSVHVAAQTRTDACRLDGRPCAELAGRGSGREDTAAIGPPLRPHAIVRWISRLVLPPQALAKATATEVHSHAARRRWWPCDTSQPSIALQSTTTQ